MKEDGCKTATLWNDKTVYGAGLARNIKQSAETAGLKIENEQGTDKNSPNYRAIASKIKSDCLVWAGVTGENGVQVFKDVASANKTVKLYGPDGVTEEAFSNPKKGGIPASVGARTKTTVATLGAKDLPGSDAVLAKYKSTYKTQSVDPYAIYGYEAMALALDALKRAGDKANVRDEVVKALFATKDRDSILGKYSIDANGDTTLTDYGLYVIKNGLPTYSKKIEAAVG
jgi:branched-chain amino acid transport system substrate-binding protein